MSIYSVEQLIQQIAAGLKFQHLYFWGHRQQADGSIGSNCCSQWFSSGFHLNEVYYPTAEHFMMAEKARLFGDNEILAKILAASTPDQAKGLGRKVKGFNQESWENSCFEIVVRGNLAKFSQNRKLKNWLASTEPLVLVEASPVDQVWGIGLHRDDERARDPRQWLGKNLLGFALMQVRDQLIKEP